MSTQENYYDRIDWVLQIYVFSYYNKLTDSISLSWHYDYLMDLIDL